MPDETFDEDKAKKLIENLRAEIKTLKDNKEPQAERDGKTIAALRREIDELKPLAEKNRQLEESTKTESQKLNDRMAAAEKRAQEAEDRTLRMEVAASKGLSPAQAKRLQGGTREELEADADDLLTTFKPSEGGGGGGTGAGATTTRPKENLQGGGEPNEEPDERDPRKLAAQIPRR